ncbi:MFS transporter [Schumannella luteola]|uniref:DHA2 family multidrug resistance protein-like MFS transporter n=1 Tax=Schumannella luteola TaxID=472059 RepID=A0A852YD94_9MICO|nr:MFS transporter [Schumannella luteola]NYG99254.1 DHA2 family multidrug resistance protein-like MFS transporter [Schumannella luteola]TPX05637.1 MFS transporter [Schumannella luteola]
MSSTTDTASTPLTDDAPRAGRRGWAALVVLMLPTLLISIDNTVLSFALPTIARDLEPSAQAQLWIVDAYPLVLAGLLVAMGNFGDRVGRRRMLLIGSSGFAVISVLAAFAPNAELLIAGRVLMGFFGAMIMPSTLSLLRSIFLHRAQRRLAIAIWATGFSLGSAIGPMVGGLLLQHFFWGSVFLIAVPVLLPLLVLAPILVPESRDPKPGPVDVLAIVLSVLTVAPIVGAVKTLATGGELWLVAVLVAVGVVSGVLLVRRLLRSPTPMLDVRLFRRGAFSGAILINLASVIALVGLIFFVTQHLQLVVGLDAFSSALVLGPGVLALIVFSFVAVRLVKRVRPGYVIAGSVLAAGLGYLTLGLGGSGVSVTQILIAFVLVGAGIGAAETLSNDLVIANAPADKAGAAAGVSETAYELGAVLGTTILGGLVTALYRAELHLPDGLSAAQAGSARETLGGAIHVAEGLPAELGDALREAARSAFDLGVVSTAYAGAALMVVAATLALVTLRRARA